MGDAPTQWKRPMKSIANEQWNDGLAALLSFKKREGHCRVPRFHIEAGYRLGQWVAVQRYHKQKLRLQPQRKARLEAEGFMWSRRDWLWERAFAALQKFRQREGHCLVPPLHVEDGINLGYWTSVQRRMRKKMLAEPKERLDELGFVWRPQSAVHVARVLRQSNRAIPSTGGSAAVSGDAISSISP